MHVRIRKTLPLGSSRIRRRKGPAADRIGAAAAIVQEAAANVSYRVSAVLLKRFGRGREEETAWIGMSCRRTVAPRAHEHGGLTGSPA
jgi:hypothetical protein